MKLALFLRKAITFGIYIFALSIPFNFPLKNINLDIPLIKSLLILEILILLFLWYLVIIFERRLEIKLTSLVFPVIAFFIIHIFSAVFPSEKMIWSLKYTFRFFGLGLIFFIIINFIKSKKEIEYLINSLFLSVGVASIFVIIQYFFPYLLVDLQYFFKDVKISVHRIRGLFGWPTDMSVYLGTFIPLILSCLIYNPKETLLKKIFYLSLLTIIIFALVLSKTRGWILGLFFGLSSLWFIYLIKKRDYRTIRITVVIFGLIVLLFFISGRYKFVMGDLEPSEKGRIMFIKEALRLIKEHPFKGIGADMCYWKSVYKFRSHNIFLETTVNLGIFGLLVLLWLFYSIFKFITKGITSYSEIGYLKIGIFSSLLSFLAHNQVDYFWQLPEITGLFWILVGIGVSLNYYNA